MRRFSAWLAGFVGGAAVARAFRRRPVPPGNELPVEAADPAEALKAKLAESRVAEEPEPEPEEADVDARRRSVHERARSAIDEMQTPGADS